MNISLSSKMLRILMFLVILLGLIVAFYYAFYNDPNFLGEGGKFGGGGATSEW